MLKKQSAPTQAVFMYELDKIGLELTRFVTFGAGRLFFFLSSPICQSMGC
jgi:hypothetical protein